MPADELGFDAKNVPSLLNELTLRQDFEVAVRLSMASKSDEELEVIRRRGESIISVVEKMVKKATRVRGLLNGDEDMERGGIVFLRACARSAENPAISGILPTSRTGS